MRLLIIWMIDDKQYINHYIMYTEHTMGKSKDTEAQIWALPNFSLSH